MIYSLNITQKMEKYIQQQKKKGKLTVVVFNLKCTTVNLYFSSSRRTSLFPSSQSIFPVFSKLSVVSGFRCCLTALGNGSHCGKF